jgi:lipopolysaccharide export LptBFGC system permease protein LptF
MKYIADKLESMDHYFSAKKESEKWLMIGGIACIIAFAAYSYFIPAAENLFNESETRKNRLTKSIANEETYLNSITVGNDRNYYIKKFDRDIQEQHAQISDLNKKISYIDTNLQRLSRMLFNEKSWSIFLNSITESAKANNIDIGSISNNYLNNKGSFGHVLEIDVGSQGEFKNLVKFMNEIEQNVLVTDIYATHLIGGKRGVNADINISVWGINH